MIIAFLNMRGLVGKTKKMVLKRFISVHSPDMVLLQEIVGASHELCNFLKRSLKGVYFLGLDSLGNSGDLISSWRDTMEVIDTFFVSLGLMLEVFAKGRNQSTKVLNLYGLYVDK